MFSKAARSVLPILLATLLTGHAYAQHAGTPYVFSRAPLARAPYTTLPLGAVEPAGWLHAQLRTLADGMSGHLDEVYENVGPSNAWLGGDGDAWERGPYWLDGLVPLAYILKDDELIAKARPWIEHVLTNQREDGYIGPRDTDGLRGEDGKVQRGNKGDWWPRMVMLKVLQSYYDATGDPRVLTAMTKYFRYQLARIDEQPLSHWTYWAQHRGGENVASVLWLYNRTGDAFLLNLAETLSAQTSDWTNGFLHEQPPSSHGVNVAMGVKEPGLQYLRTGDARFLEAVRTGLNFLRRDHGQIQGMFSGDEPLHGADPIQGTELCTVVEFMYSLETLAQITGDVRYADHLERVAYNALPTQITDDGWARQYFQQPNQVAVSKDVDQYVQQHGGTSHLIGLLTGYPCCTTNLHQGWPKFTQNLWLASEDGGLAALAYAPSRVTARVAGGATVRFEEETVYPFEDRVRLTFRSESPAAFPLHLRIPFWAEGAEVRVNGQPVESVQTGRMLRIERTWNDGDEVDLHLPAAVEVSLWHKGLAGVERGPLVFAMPIEEEWKKIDEVAGIPTYEVHPASPWNYGLMVEEPIQIDRSIRVAANPWTPETAPITLRVRAKRIPEWKAYDHVHGVLPYSPVRSDLRVETIRLIPYGASTLRIAEFPVIAKPGL